MPSWSILGRFVVPPGGARPLKTMLGPTREHDLAKIEVFLLSCSWVRVWALRGVSREPLGTLLAPLGALLGALGTLLVRSWGALGHSWGALGALLGHSGTYLGALGLPEGSQDTPRSLFGTILGTDLETMV